MKASFKGESNEFSDIDWMIDVFGQLNLNDSLKNWQLFNQKFEILNELHCSPNSCVYLVAMQAGNSLIENNLILSSIKNGALKAVTGATFNYLLDKEYRILKGLDHSNIIKPIEYKQWEVSDNKSISYMWVPYFKNGDLNEFVKNRGGLGETEALGYFMQMASALEYLHELNIAHRDIKLENIVLDDSMNVQLIDFGFSYKYETESERESGKRFMSDYIESQLIGSLSYMAPELIESIKRSNSDGQTSENSDYYIEKIEKYKNCDIYALGVALFTMVVGTPPFVSATKDDINFRNFLLSKKRGAESRFWTRHPTAKALLEKGELSTDFMNLIEVMLNINPEERIRINSVMNHPWIQKSLYNSTIELKRGNSEQSSKSW